MHLFINYLRSVHNYVLYRVVKKGSFLVVNLTMLLAIREVETEYGQFLMKKHFVFHLFHVMLNC